MTFLTLVLIAVILLAIIGLGWNTFVIAVSDGFDRTLDVGISIIKNLTQEVQEVQAQPTDWEGGIDDCITSLHAENPRQAHLLECDEYMPMIPEMIKAEMINNSSKITKQVNEYLNERALEAFTEEDMIQKTKEFQEAKERGGFGFGYKK